MAPRKSRKPVFLLAFLFFAVLPTLFNVGQVHLPKNFTEISVIIPCCNCEKWLNETLFTLSRQSFRNFTTIMIDDGSRVPITSSRLTEAYDREIHLIRHYRNLGLSAARNTGVMAANSHYVVFLDPDDLIEVDALEKLWLRLSFEESPKAAFAYPGVNHFRAASLENPKDNAIFWVDKVRYSADRLLKENFIPSFALIHRDLYLRAGGMCQDHIKYWEDYDFWLRLANLGYEGVLLEEALFYYRRHPDGRSSAIRRKVKEPEWRAELNRNNARKPRLSEFELDLDGEEMEKDPFDHLPCYKTMADFRFSLYSRIDPLSAVLNRLFDLIPRRISAAKALESLNLKGQPLGINEKQISQPHRVLFIIPWMQIGGADAYDRNVIKTLRESGNYHVTIVTEIDIPKHEALSSFSKIVDEIFELPHFIDEHRADAVDATNKFLLYLVQSRDVDSVYVRNSHAGYRFFKYLHESGHKDGIHLIDIQHLESRDDEGWERTTIPYHHLIDRRIMASEYLSNVQKTLLGASADASSMVIIHPSVDLDNAWNPLTYAESNNASDYDPAITIFFVGRFDEQKDPLKWVQVAKHLSTLFISLTFVMIGDGPLANDASHLALDLGVEVRFPGYQEPANVARALICGAGHDGHSKCKERKKSILMMTSQFEGLPFVIVEALALGVPVISTPFGAINEIKETLPSALFISSSGSIEDILVAANEAIAKVSLFTPSTEFVDRFSIANFKNRIHNVFNEQ